MEGGVKLNTSLLVGERTATCTDSPVSRPVVYLSCSFCPMILQVLVWGGEGHPPGRKASIFR